jgi:MerR family transcriptional regulator, light-induced transcriptional regulator
MVYIRNKNVKGIFYSYLVKSRWDKEENTSKQEIIKYFGKASDVTN